MRIKESKPVLSAVAKEILAERKKEGELGYEQEQSLESLEKYSKHTPAKSHEMVKKLMKDGKINNDTAIKIVDISPTNPYVLKAILSKDKVELSDDEVSAIVKEFA